MESLQRLLDFLFDRLFVQLTKGLFVLLLLMPGLAAVLVNLSQQPPLHPSHPVLWMLLSRVDSGFQLGVGPYFLRGWLLVLTGFAVLIGVQVPASGRKLWIASWIFQLLAVLSAMNCSHPYEALVTVADTALLNVVALLAYALTPRTILPAALSVGAFMVSVLSLDTYLRFTPEDGRLNGTFHQPNMTATFMAAALPWVLNQYLGDRRRPLVQAMGLLASLLILSTLLLTGTRAAWIFVAVCLGARWWLGSWLRHSRLGWRHGLGVVGVSLLVLLTYWQGTHSWAAFACCALILVVGAYRSGIGGTGLLLLITSGCFAYGSFSYLTSVNSNSQAHIESRVRDLSEGTDNSVLSRVEFWRAALLMGLDKPVLGVGPRGFHRYYPSYQVDQRWFSKYAHSALLSCWAELGVPGTVMLAVLAALWLRAVIQGLSRLSLPCEDSGLHPTSALLDSMTACLILSLCTSVDVQWQFPAINVTWAAWLGYSLALAWSEPPGVQAPSTVQEDETINPWTLRPAVILCYFLIALMGVGLALDMCWAFGQYYNDLSEELLKRGKVAESIDCDKRSIQLNPFQGSYFHHLGLGYSAALSMKSPLVKPQEYLAVAERAVRLDSHRAVHYDLLAKAWRTNGKPELARQALRKALECDPINYPSFYTSLAELADDAKDESQRDRILLACVYRFPPDSLGTMFAFRSADIERQMTEVFHLLAGYSDPGKHPDIALGYYDQLLKIQPEDLAGRMGRLVCLINLNRMKVAHKESLELYYKAPRAETLDILKHVYQFENLPFDPSGLPPVVAPPAPVEPAATPTPAPGPDQRK